MAANRFSAALVRTKHTGSDFLETFWLEGEGETRREGGRAAETFISPPLFSYDSFKKLVEVSIKVFQDYSEHVFNSKTRTLHQSCSQLGGGASRH